MYNQRPLGNILIHQPDVSLCLPPVQAETCPIPLADRGRSGRKEAIKLPFWQDGWGSVARLGEVAHRRPGSNYSKLRVDGFCVKVPHWPRKTRVRDQEHTWKHTNITGHAHKRSGEMKTRQMSRDKRCCRTRPAGHWSAERSLKLSIFVGRTGQTVASCLAISSYHTTTTPPSPTWFESLLIWTKQHTYCKNIDMIRMKNTNFKRTMPAFHSGDWAEKQAWKRI